MRRGGGDLLLRGGAKPGGVSRGGGGVGDEAGEELAARSDVARLALRGEGGRVSGAMRRGESETGGWGTGDG